MGGITGDFEGGKTMGFLGGINDNFEVGKPMGSLGGINGRDHWAGALVTLRVGNPWVH